jgi:predicted 3-demethylubiquinone-9 3-methyltransferase (glyoxalase superfamily)
MSKITLCLWFDGQAEAAAQFYVSLLPNSKIEQITRYGADTRGAAEGSVMLVEFTLDGQRYIALNGGPMFKPTPALSLSVSCTDQAEVDRLWGALLSGGGKAMQCGWLTDRFGVTWQIVPEMLPRLMRDPDAAKVRRVTQAMMQMVKLDIATLEAAAVAA